MVWNCDQMVVCVVKELQDGFYVNFGIGLLMFVVNYVLEGVEVWLQLENGLFGIGLLLIEDEVDVDFINVGKQIVMMLLGLLIFLLVDLFVMVCGGYINFVIFGVMQVSKQGDFVNWMILGKMIKGMGGVMDFVVGVGCVVVLMEYVVKGDQYKIFDECNLLLMGVGVVDLIIIDFGVIEVMLVGLKVFEFVDGVSVEEIQLKMGVLFDVSVVV